MKKLYVVLAQTLRAYKSCLKSKNSEWINKHQRALEALVSEHMPSGAGIDNGVKLSLQESLGEKLVFHTSYHHMNEVGMYDGWTDHTVKVYPSLAFGITISISGHNRNDIKSYLHDVFHEALTKEVCDATKERS